MRKYSGISYKIVFWGVLYLVGLVCSSCQESSPDIRQLLSTNQHEQNWIDTVYKSQRPLAQILNPENFSNSCVSFELKTTSSIQIYAVGESLLNIRDDQRQYYLANDKIKLIFGDTRKNGSTGTYRSKEFNIDLKSKQATENDKITCEWLIEKNAGQIALIRVPLHLLFDRPSIPPDSLDFNVIIGDNDDGLMQEAQLAWQPISPSKASLKNSRISGKIIFSDKSTLPENRIACSLIPHRDGEPKQESIIWERQKPFFLKNIIYGTIKDRFDLSASGRMCYDQRYLYLRIEILDSRQKVITRAKLKERHILTDYGWIEDSRGHIIWIMHAKQCRYAGGSFRNQKADTTLSLKKGLYKLHYITDEAHAFNQWIGQPPKTPFYGIVAFQRPAGLR